MLHKIKKREHHFAMLENIVEINEIYNVLNTSETYLLEKEI